MMVIIARVNVNWGNAFRGYIFSKYTFSSRGIYTCTYDDDFQLNMALAVGIIGATIMPHSLFLGY